MKVFTIKHTTEKKDFEAIIPKVFANKELADKYLQKIYDEYVEKAGGYINWSVISNNKEARIETNYGFDLFEIIELEVEGGIDYLQEFCKEEAPFRLREYFNLSDEKIEEYSGEVEEIIRDTIDNCDELYEAMDDRIRESLGDDYIELDFFDEEDENDFNDAWEDEE